MTASLDRIEAAVRGWLGARDQGPLILGLCGAQGSGKSTLAAGLRDRLEAGGLSAAILSLDDLYLSRAERSQRAHDIHPLLATRGVPLTHDVAAGVSIFDAVKQGHAVRLPRFDKARDEPEPKSRWHTTPATLDVLIFEGWCVGARPQPDGDLGPPINALERRHDADSVWRRAVNEALRADYASLFARIDRLVLLAAPSFDVVAGWRLQQEEALRRAIEAQGGHTTGLMDETAIARFVQHYERLTRWILAELPARADCVLRLGDDRRLLD